MQLFKELRAAEASGYGQLLTAAFKGDPFLSFPPLHFVRVALHDSRLKLIQIFLIKSKLHLTKLKVSLEVSPRSS